MKKPSTTTPHTKPAKKQGGTTRGSASAKSKGTKRQGKGEPIRRDEDVQNNSDEHIDQDFPGYPHHPSHPAHASTTHNGSAGAFDATEHSHDDDDEGYDNDDFEMDR